MRVKRGSCRLSKPISSGSSAGAAGSAREKRSASRRSSRSRASSARPWPTSASSSPRSRSSSFSSCVGGGRSPSRGTARNSSTIRRPAGGAPVAAAGRRGSRLPRQSTSWRGRGAVGPEVSTWPDSMSSPAAASRPQTSANSAKKSSPTIVTSTRPPGASLTLTRAGRDADSSAARPWCSATSASECRAAYSAPMRPTNSRIAPASSATLPRASLVPRRKS